MWLISNKNSALHSTKIAAKMLAKEWNHPLLKIFLKSPPQECKHNILVLQNSKPYVLKFRPVRRDWTWSSKDIDIFICHWNFSLMSKLPIPYTLSNEREQISFSKVGKAKVDFSSKRVGGGGIHNYFHDSNYYFQFNFHNLSLVFTRAVVGGGVEFFEL